MSPTPVNLSWAPGVRLLTCIGDSPEGEVDLLPTLPPPFLRMFFSAHHRFTDRSVSIAQASTEYQAMIVICEEDLRNYQIQNPSAQFPYKSLLSEIQHARNVWSFIHAVYIMSAADRNAHISRYLSDWYRTNYTNQATEQQATTPNHDGSPNQDAMFWKKSVTQILHGDFSHCRQRLADLIRDRDLAQEKWRETTAAIHLGQYTQVPETVSPFILLEAIIEGAPEHNLASRADGSWAVWQDACRLWASFTALEDCEGARAVLLVIGGDVDAIAHAASSWEEMLVAMTLFLRDDSMPGGNLQGGLSVLMSACGHASSHFKAPSHVAGGALLEAGLGNLKDAIVRLCCTLPSSWFAAHLCDLLVRGGLLDDVVEGGEEEWSTIGMREFYLKQFASSLERYRGCWRLSVDYLLACRTHGVGMLVDLLGRVPIHGCGDRTVEKMLRVCERKNLQKASVKICERVGMGCLHHENLGGAMCWFARGRLGSRCRAVADMAVESAERGGPLSAGARTLECVAEAVEAFGDADMQRGLDYVMTYYEMQEARARLKGAKEGEDEEEMQACAREFSNCASGLLGLQGIDRRFWIVIVYEGARLLEMYPTTLEVFSRKCLLDFISALELVAGPFPNLGLLGGLRRRVSYDGATPGELVQIDAQLCSMEKVDGVLDHCRKVLVEAVARKINEMNENA